MKLPKTASPGGTETQKERKYYEAQNRARQQVILHRRIFLKRYVTIRGCSTHGWRQPQIVPDRESKEVREPVGQHSTSGRLPEKRTILTGHN